MSRATFAEYLRELVGGASFARQKDLADALGIKAARLSRVINGKDQYKGFSVENCLRLAHAAGRPPSEVLRAAGKDAIADLLELLFPKASKAVPPKEHQLLSGFRALDEEAQDAILEVLRLVPAAEQAMEKRRGRA